MGVKRGKRCRSALVDLAVTVVVSVVRAAASAAASPSLARAKLVAVAVADAHRLFAVLLSHLVHVLAHLAAKVVHLVVEPVPGGLPADADRLADGLPGGTICDGFFHQLGLPSRELGLEGSGSTEGFERIEAYDQKDALGFINLIGLPMKVRALAATAK